MGFFIKKMIGHLIYPLPLLFLIILSAWFLRKKTPRLSRWLLILGSLFLVTISYDPGMILFVKPLESIYEKFDIESSPQSAYVVVLGGGSCADRSLPITSQLSNASLIRLVEGVRIANMIPESKLITTGGAVFDTVPIAHLTRDLAVSIGFCGDRIAVVDRANDTETEALHTYDIVGSGPVILVTSALHMHRAKALFEKVGIDVIPAPTNHLWVESGGVDPGFLFPSSMRVAAVRSAFHEYFGYLWSFIRGRV